MAEEQEEEVLEVEHTMEEGFLSDAEILGRSRQKWRLVRDLRRELEGHMNKVADLKSRIKAAVAEIEDVEMRRDDPQLPIHLTQAGAEPPCVTPDGHAWHPVDGPEGFSLEDCAFCPLQRTKPENAGPEYWAYTKRDEAAAETPGEPVAS